MNTIARLLAGRKELEQVSGNQTWKQFNKLINKKLILFGSGKVCQYFLEKYGRKYDICCVFDNDISRQGRTINDFLELKDDKYDNVYVNKPEKDNTEDVVVLICTTKYISQIYEQLLQMGFCNVFSLAHMEGKKLSCKLQIKIYKIYIYLKSLKKLPERILRKYTFWTVADIGYRKKYLQCLKYPIQKDKILFFSEGKYKDHQKYISNKLVESGITCEIVWLIKRGEAKPEKVRCVEFEDKEKVIYEFATSRVWFDSEALPMYVMKRRGQILIKTKHWSSITLKKFYFDTPVYYKTMPHINQQWKHNTKMTDYFLVGSEFDKRTCRSGFHYKGKFLEFGSPRTDILFTPDEFRIKVKEIYQIPQKAKIVMYAPTFRLGRGTEDCNVPNYNLQMPDFENLKGSLEERFDEDWQVVLRLHPLVRNKEELMSEVCVDASAYDDVQELLAAADMIITDYSSLMFEPAMVGKMVILYAPDVEDYCANERGLWFELTELPFPIAKSDVELQHIIKSFDEEQYRMNVKRFFDKHGVAEDGHACDRTVEFLKKVINT